MTLDELPEAERRTKVFGPIVWQSANVCLRYGKYVPPVPFSLWGNGEDYRAARAISLKEAIALRDALSTAISEQEEGPRQRYAYGRLAWEQLCLSL